MKPEKQLKIGIILMFIIFIMIYGTYMLFKLSEDNLVLLISGGITGGIGIFIIIIQSKSSRNVDDVKNDMADIRDGVLDVRDDMIVFKKDQLEMKSDLIEINNKVDKVAFVVTEKEIQDAEKFEYLTNGFMKLEKEIFKNGKI